MAQARFQLPNDNVSSDYRQYNTAPEPLPVCKYLREKATGYIHPYHEGLAARSDLVEPYDGELPSDDAQYEIKVTTPPKKVAKPKAKPVAQATAEPEPSEPLFDAPDSLDIPDL